MEKPAYEAYSKLPLLVLVRHFPDRCDDEDMLQEGNLELWLAVQDADKVHTNFFAYAYRRILRCYARYLKNTDPFLAMPWEDNKGADSASNDFEDAKALCESISRLLQGDECKVLCLCAKGYNFRDISKKLGKNYNTVRRLAKQGGDKLRDAGAI